MKQRFADNKLPDSPKRTSYPPFFKSPSYVHPLLDLQRSIGNRAFDRLLNTPFKQNLTLNDSCPNDPARGPATGMPLPQAIRRRMERSFHADFTDVRLRGSGLPANADILAKTQGDRIDFAPGAFDPGKPQSLELLGHELAHVLQQRQGRGVDTMPGRRSGLALNLEKEAGRAGQAAARGHQVPGIMDQDCGDRPRSVHQAVGPLTDAVTAVRTHGPTPGSGMVTETLVQGIREAEGEFLRMHPLNRWGGSLGLTGTQGPGQLGEPAVDSVDRNFAAASAAFAAIYGPPPTTWEEKVNHANWSYFYIAAYLAFSINEARRVFQPATPILSDEAINILNLGIAMYHGAFETIRDMRRRIAGEQSSAVSPGAVSWQMVEEETRSGTALWAELELERYMMLARGSWEFDFGITAGMDSRFFDVHAGKVRTTIIANYQNSIPLSGSRTSTYRVTLKKREAAAGPGGAVAMGFNPISSFRYTVGVRGRAEWTGLAAGEYALEIRKIEDPYSPDVLGGHGLVETIY